MTYARAIVRARVWALIAASVLMVLSGAAHAQTSPPVEVFGRLPAVADAAISPDGTKVALAMFEAGVGSIVVHDLEAGRRVFTVLVSEADQNLRGVGWADDQHVTFSVSITLRPGRVLPYGVRFRGAPRRVDYYGTGILTLASGDMRFLTTDEENPWADQGSEIIAPIEGDPGYGRMFGWSSPYIPRHPTVHRVNLETGRSRSVSARGANGDTIDYLLDERGAVALRTDSDAATNRWRIFTYDGENPRLLLEDVSETGEPMSVAGLLPDGRMAAYDWSEDGRTESLVAVDRGTGAREVIVQRGGGGVDGVVRDPWTGRVVGARWTDEVTTQKFFDPALQAIADKIGDRIVGDAVVMSWSRDRRRFLVYAERGLDGGGYYIFEPSPDRLLLLGRLYPELAEHDGGVRQSIQYSARDGVRIPAYLTLPPGVERAQGLPLVVLVHGGPRGRDTFAFDWWASFLASRGYLVLQPNFRGSSGYGRAWMEAGYRQWGGLMQTDVEDGAAALVRAGMADPARICIMGASYGGYAALAGATMTPDRYSCAVSVAGLSDLDLMARADMAQAGSQSIFADDIRRIIGDRSEDRDHIRSISPANLADRARAPVLLIHGTDDTVVPIEHSRLMERRLRAAGKDVRLVELTGDDHWLSDEPTRVQMLREIEAFLAQHIGPRPAP